MRDITEERFDWERSQKVRDNERDDARWRLEQQKAAWEKSTVLKLLLPVAAIVLAATQGYVGFSEYRLHQQHETTETALARDRAERELGAQYSVFVELALRYRLELASPDPEVKCGILRYVRVSPAYVQAIGKLGIDASLCDQPKELVAAISNFANKQAELLDPYREGASREAKVIRRDPTTKQLFQAQCQVSAVNLRGQIKTDRCALPPDVPKGATIYRVDYSCADPRCGWSYNPDPTKGYAPATRILDDGRTAEWSRKWDGDDHLETYTLYYQLPDSLAKGAIAK